MTRKYYLGKNKNNNCNTYDNIKNTSNNYINFTASPILDFLEMKLNCSLNDKKLICYEIEFDENNITEDRIISIFKKHGIDLFVNKNIKMQIKDIDIIIKNLLNKDENDEEYIIDYNQSQEDLINFDIMKDNFDQVYEYLKNLNIKDNTLFITDPYLFPYRHFSWYETGLTSLFKELSPKNIVVYISENNLCKELFQRVNDELKKSNITLNHVKRDDYHDRFWICQEKEKGIVLGISLNYEKVKKAYIEELNYTDTKTIIDDLKGQREFYLKEERFYRSILSEKNKINFNLFVHNDNSMYFGHMKINGKDLKRANGNYKDIDIIYNGNKVSMTIGGKHSDNNIYLRYYVNNSNDYIVIIDNNYKEAKLYNYKADMNIDKSKEFSKATKSTNDHKKVYIKDINWLLTYCGLPNDNNGKNKINNMLTSFKNNKKYSKYNYEELYNFLDYYQF